MSIHSFIKVILDKVNLGCILYLFKMHIDYGFFLHSNSSKRIAFLLENVRCDNKDTTCFGSRALRIKTQVASHFVSFSSILFIHIFLSHSFVIFLSSFFIFILSSIFSLTILFSTISKFFSPCQVLFVSFWQPLVQDHPTIKEHIMIFLFLFLLFLHYCYQHLFPLSMSRSLCILLTSSVVFYQTSLALSQRFLKLPFFAASFIVIVTIWNHFHSSYKETEWVMKEPKYHYISLPSSLLQYCLSSASSSFIANFLDIFLLSSHSFCIFFFFHHLLALLSSSFTVFFLHCLLPSLSSSFTVFFLHFLLPSLSSLFLVFFLPFPKSFYCSGSVAYFSCHLPFALLAPLINQAFLGLDMTLLFFNSKLKPHFSPYRLTKMLLSFHFLIFTKM